MEKTKMNSTVKFSVIISFTMILLIIIGSLGWNYIKASPRYSLYKMYEAITDTNYDEFSKYFDTDLVIDNILYQYEKSQDSNNGSDSFSTGLLALFKPKIKEYVITEIKRQIEMGKFFNTETISVKNLKDLRKIWKATKIEYLGKIANITVKNEKNEELSFQMKRQNDYWKIIEIEIDQSVLPDF